MVSYENLTGKKVVVVEDDRSMLEYLVLNLEECGCSVDRAMDVETAERLVGGSAYDFAIVDMYIPQTLGDPHDRVMRGEQLAYTMRKELPGLSIIGISANIQRRPFTPLNNLFSGFIYKGDLKSHEAPIILFETMDMIVNPVGVAKPRVLIVHGHDEETLLQVKNFIQNKIGFDEPVILRERPSAGKTIIEKFEREAEGVDIVFVLLTPDDEVVGNNNEKLRRARQNVIFELGFFYGKLQRNGSVFLLSKGSLELPSDIAGVVYIDISYGVDSSGEIIRRELEAQGWL